MPDGSSLIEQTSAGGPFVNRSTMQELGVSQAEIAEFLNGYTIADNWNERELPAGYEDRGDENVFAAAFPSDWIERVNRCAFGQKTPIASSN